ncbi:MAG: sarcosine oxidase subunit delta [Pseudomonadota bacterium]
MIRINCPVCGLRDETEFTYGEDASVTRPAMDEEAMQPWLDYVFNRDNPRGWHREYWHHVQGCRQWVVVERNTLTHDVRSCRLAREVADETA